MKLMPPANRHFLLLLVVLLYCASSRMAEAQPRTRFVVFSVSGSGAEGSMDPVVVVEGKQLRLPYEDETEAAQQKFGAQYLAAGKVYRLIFGGGEAGTVKVDKWGVGCNNIHAQVTISTSARLGGNVMGLATSSPTLGKRAIARRPRLGPRI